MANNSKRPQALLQMGAEQRRRFLESFDRVYSDVDGVVYNMENNIPRADEAYEALERAGKQLTFVTNNSVRTVNSTVKRFAASGIRLTPEQIWHPAQTLIYYLRSIKFEGLIYIIATPQFKKLLVDAGYQLIDGPNHLIDDTFEDLSHHIYDKQPVRAVVIDLDFNLTAVKMLRAHMYLRHPDCQLITGATDRMLPVGKGLNIIGPGAFSSILDECSAKEATTVGKPGRVLGEMLCQHHNVTDPSRVLMIGDMLAQDVRFGRMFGFQTLLVLSGGCSLEQLMAETDPEQLPDYYTNSIVDFVQFLAETEPKAHV